MPLSFYSPERRHFAGDIVYFFLFCSAYKLLSFFCAVLPFFLIDSMFQVKQSFYFFIFSCYFVLCCMNGSFVTFLPVTDVKVSLRMLDFYVVRIWN